MSTQSTDLAILGSHLSTLIEARSVSQHELDPLVAYAISETQDGRTPDTRRAQWEYLLKNEVFKLAATEGDLLKGPQPSYFDELKSRLDLVLAFTEHDVCDASFPFSVLEDLLETQTVASCWHIFSWIEERTERLTTNMSPAKGKSLVLLRTLNDLLRRLSKTGKNTMFCGRILNFLSSVFSLGERSGVNLRGDYGPQWEGVVTRKDFPRPSSPRPNAEEDIKMAAPDKESAQPAAQTPKPEEQAKTPPAEKKDDFFQTFWSLQLPFSRPPLFDHTISFESFKDSVNMVLPVIAEATKKERAMMGSKVVAGNLKRKRELSPLEAVDDTGRDYFFAKFLTSPELLDLEIADTLFRRQFLFQLLILLQHLNLFTQSEKMKWETSRNRSLQMEFTLGAADVKWTQETWTKAMDELKATTPNGKAFADTVAAILERERNWIKWKNELCPPFDKFPIQPSLGEQTQEKRRKLMDAPPAWRFAWGTPSLTEVWETGFQSLGDCENPPGVDELKDLAKRIKTIDKRIEMRKGQIARSAPPKPPSPVLGDVGVKPAASQESASSQGSQGSQPILSQTSSSAPSQTSAPALSQTSALSPSQPTPTTVAPTPVSAIPTGPASLHPSLPPRPGTSPAPFTKSQTPTRHAVPPSSPAVSQPVAPKPVAPPPPKQDPQLVKFAEDKDRLSWLALRRARTEYLPLFGKIGTGDVDMLMTSIQQEEEREREKERERELKDEKPEKLEPPVVATVAETGGSPASGEAAVNGDGKSEVEGLSQESAKEPQQSQEAPSGDATTMEVDT